MMNAHRLRKTAERHEREEPSPKPTRRPGPASGDVLVSKATARTDVYSISVVPAAADFVANRYQDAVTMARTFASRRRVNAWYTCDHRHFVRLCKRPRVDEAALDAILADSFPASDPPPWTLGVEQ